MSITYTCPRWTVLLLLLVSLSACAPQQKENEQDKSVWYQCESDSDCIVILKSCCCTDGYTAINRDYRTESELNRKGKCSDSICTLFACPLSEPKCIESKCVSVNSNKSKYIWVSKRAMQCDTSTFPQNTIDLPGVFTIRKPDGTSLNQTITVYYAEKVKDNDPLHTCQVCLSCPTEYTDYLIIERQDLPIIQNIGYKENGSLSRYS